MKAPHPFRTIGLGLGLTLLCAVAFIVGASTSGSTCKSARPCRHCRRHDTGRRRRTVLSRVTFPHTEPRLGAPAPGRLAVVADAADIATHEHPVWRERANYVLQADLAEHGLPGRYEQLWARSVGADRYELCCLPFFTYGYALGDIVALRVTAGPFDRVLGSVVRPSNRALLRVAFLAPDRHEDLHASLADSDRPHEWRSGGFVAIDIEGQVPEPLWSTIDALASDGHVAWEWGKDPALKLE
jgi:uncharacterized protein DUF4265